MSMTYVSDTERALAVRGAILDLAQKDPDGVCQPSALVNAAKAKRHPCHDLFEWDDSKAGAAYRVDQARRIIRGVRVTFDGDDTRAPAFVHVKVSSGDKHRDGYMPTDKAMARPDMKEQVLGEAIAQLRGLQNRYQAIKELSPVWHALDDVDA